MLCGRPDRWITFEIRPISDRLNVGEMNLQLETVNVSQNCITDSLSAVLPVSSGGEETY
jgi:hypothetical protein